MKNKKTAIFGLAALSLAALASCGTSGPAEADTIFENARFYYDTSVEEAYNISVDIGTDAEVTALASGRYSAEEGQYINRDGILTISGEFLSTLTAGEKTITVTTEDGRVSVDAYLVNKIITTAEDFQNINEQLDGYYILGNDIDLSSIKNFEPLGYYYSETDSRNEYFHGILDGNGYTVRNATVHYSDNVATNYNVYTETGSTMFESDAHKAGDNIGLFQIIGSAGVVRNIGFDNISVMGRTIVGALAGNVQGQVYNVYMGSGCEVQMSTHFYDDDCNMGGVFGIVASGASVYNVISEVTDVSIGAKSDTSQSYNGTSIEIAAGCYLDFDDDYSGITTGNGWDHPAASSEDVDAPWWRFASSDKDDTTDSNGSPTNGVYAFVGKSWGTVSNCVAKSFNISPMNGTARAVNFGQTHLAANKSDSGDTDLGSIENCTLTSDLTDASLYSSFDTDYWTIEDGSVPTLNTIYTTIDNTEAE